MASAAGPVPIVFRRLRMVFNGPGGRPAADHDLAGLANVYSGDIGEARGTVHCRRRRLQRGGPRVLRRRVAGEHPATARGVSARHRGGGRRGRRRGTGGGRYVRRGSGANCHWRRSAASSTTAVLIAAAAAAAAMLVAVDRRAAAGSGGGAALALSAAREEVAEALAGAGGEEAVDDWVGGRVERCQTLDEGGDCAVRGSRRNAAVHLNKSSC